MELITSRKNRYISHIMQLSKDADYRRKEGEYVCDGHKLLSEALEFGARVNSVMWREKPMCSLPNDVTQYCVPAELFEYASPLKDSPGPVFTVKITDPTESLPGDKVIILENVQDPGNVGTVIRTANAMGFDAVVLTGNCADLYNPKTVRATMGAIFRQCVVVVPITELKPLIIKRGLKLCGAALTADALDIRKADLSVFAVAIGSEGKGLSPEMLELCDLELIIPMQPGSESLNAAVAAAVIMWERARRD